MAIHTLSLEKFPVQSSPGHETADSITPYLEVLFQREGLADDASLRLPSLLDLSTFFRCPHLEVYDAFQQLRKRGYEYELTGLDDPVLFWVAKDRRSGIGRSASL